MISRRFLLQFDYTLFTAIVALALLGAAGVYSASAPGSEFFFRQILWIGLGITICLGVASIDYHVWTHHALFLYTCLIILLIATLLFGTEINESKSWIGLGKIRFQPSEMSKIVVILALTRCVAELHENYLQSRHFLLLVGLTLLPVLLVILQGDLGTALMYFPVLLGITIVAGLKVRFLIAILLITVCVAPVGWFFLKNYQKERILVTLDPDRDPQGFGYQTRQSKIAIGSGGLLGKGLGAGLQSQLGFVPEIHTDFIFALLAEETGFAGASFILLLYLLVLSRLIRIARLARDRAGILITTGIASLIFFHVVVNVGMALGILPTIGIPLPLLSYGGSSTSMIFAAMGLALNVGCQRFVY